jgi:group I intron endonuclease
LEVQQGKKEMKIHKVYLLTFPNGKKYCGYTSQDLKKRWNNGHGYEKCPLVYKAILKYGWDKVKKEIIFKSQNEEEALLKEKEIIKLFDLINPEKGYNLHEGGRPTGGAQFLTEEGRKKISEANKKRWADPEYKKMMSEKAKLHPPSKECIRKGIAAAAKANKGRTPTNAKQVIQLDKETLEIIKTFPSAMAASLEITGKKDGCTNILKVCKHQRNSAYG